MEEPMPKSTAALGMMLCLIVGVIAGVLFETSHPPARSEPCGASNVSTEPRELLTPEICNETITRQTQLLVEKQNALDEKQKILDGMTAIAQVNRNSLTVIYEPGQFNVSLSPLSRGLLGALFSGVQMPDMVNPPKPRWIVAGRTMPQFVGNPQGLAYRFFDLSTNTWVGPAYAPKPLQVQQQ